MHNKYITYGRLCSMISIKPEGHVPTYKSLIENETPMMVSPDGSVMCFKSGYVAYSSTSGRHTVFSVFDCETYTYEPDSGSCAVTLTKEQISDMLWYFPLIVFGESRAADNLVKAEMNHRYFMSDDEDIEDQPGIYTEDNPENSINEYCEILTDHQRKIMELHFRDGYTFGDVAEIMGISKGSVQKIIERSLKKIRKFIQD